MKLWIARDKDNELWCYEREPISYDDGVYQVDSYEEYVYFFKLPEDWFPEVTFENSPQEVELKLVEK